MLLVGLSLAEGHQEVAMVRRDAQHANLRTSLDVGNRSEGVHTNASTQIFASAAENDISFTTGSVWTQLRDPTLRILISFCILLIAVSIAMGVAERLREASKPSLPDEKRLKQDKGIASGWSRSLVKIILAWLTDKESGGTARAIVVGLTIWWTWREATFAFFSSAYHAGVANEISAMSQHKDAHKVYHALLAAFLYDLLVGLPTFAILSPLIDYYSRIRLRDYLTQRALHAYLKGGGHAYYHVKLGEALSGIDNPDQRIAEDAQNLADLVVAIFGSILSAVLGFSFWTSVIFGIGGAEVMNICVVFAGLRTAIAWIGFRRSLVEARQRVLAQGADLRYGLMRVRDSAEEIALGNGDQQEFTRASSLYGSLIAAVWSNLNVHIRYNISQNCSQHIPGMLLWISLLPLISSGRIQFGDAMRVHMAYDQASKVFAFLVDNFGNLTELQANAERYLSLVEACDTINGKNEKEWPKAKWGDGIDFSHPGKPELPGKGIYADKDLKVSKESEISWEEAPASSALVFDNIVLTIPNDVEKRSMGGISITCPANQGLLIMGPSGVGKTSLLRAAAGLWTTGRGTVRRPGGAKKDYLQFLPNRCYLPIGSLRQLVMYPAQQAEFASESDTTAAVASLTRARLGHLLERWGLDESQDWRAFLSAGEQQRVAFARLFWHLQGAPANSALAILDEATGALDAATEAFLYGELGKEVKSGCGGLCGFVSVGHRPDLKRLHHSWLIIGDESMEDSAEIISEGSWKTADGAAVPWKQLRRAEETAADEASACEEAAGYETADEETYARESPMAAEQSETADSVSETPMPTFQGAP